MSEDDTARGSGDDSGFRWRWIAVVPLLALVALVALYLLGVLGAPSVGVVDAGDWGEVTENRTEVVTTVWVRNPNPVGATLGTGLDAAYDVRFNGVTVATGDRTGISIPAGNTTVRLHSYVRNERIPAWWVAYVRADETLRAEVDATLRANVGPSPNVTHTVERNRTMFADSRPVVDALSAAADRTSGRYTEEIDLTRRAPFLGSALGLDGRTVTVGYEVERGWATWGEVNRSRTNVRFHLVVTNPGDVPVVAAPESVRADVAANGVRLFEHDAEALSLRDVSSERLLRPGETRTVTVVASMDNDNLDEWFTSHVRRGERSNVTARFRLLVEHPLRDATIRLPADGPATYRCSFRTGMLVDDRTTATTCERP